MPTIEIRDAPIVPVVFQSATTDQKKIGETCGVLLPAVWRFLSERGIAPSGPPFTRYTDWRETDCDLDTGFPIATPVKTEGTTKTGTLGGCQAASAIHEGAYDTLAETYTLLFTLIHEQGRTVSGPTWEFYLTDPGELPDPKDWKTEIYVPIG
jgi:effector-binding domain-containing protein